MKALVTALLLAAAAVSAGAQGSPTVAPDDPAYDDVQLLLDHGLATGAPLGQRPWSRRTFARFYRATCPDYVGPGVFAASARSIHLACVRLQARFLPEIFPADTEPRAMLHPLSELRLEALHTDAPSRAIEGNGLGTVEADTRPLTEQRLGRRYASGANGAIETAHWARIGPRLTLQARPRLSIASPRGGGSDVDLRLRTASARLVVGNAAVTVGRELTEWGSAPGGGAFFSANAPPLDLVRVASEQPFRLPWLLRRLGPTSATLQLADVGPSASHSHSRLLAYKVSVQPAPTVELGASFANHFGGAGSTDPGFGRRLVDQLPFVDILRHHSDSTEFDSDKKLGVDWRVLLPRVAHVTVFGELTLEDFDVHRLRSILTEDAAWSVGLRAPELGSPWVRGQVAYHATGIRFDEHHLVQDGYAASRFLLGDPLGRDASGWYGTLRWDAGTTLVLGVNAAYESRGNAEYVGEYTQPGLQGLVFRVVTPRPAELRRRVTLDATWRTTDGRLAVVAGAGAERVSGTPGAAAARTNGVLESRLVLTR